MIGRALGELRVLGTVRGAPIGGGRSRGGRDVTAGVCVGVESL